MANKYLGRDDAPFGEKVWGLLDEVVAGAARAQLAGRRLLDIEGPYGLAAKSLPLADEAVTEGGARLVASKALPIALIETTFTLGARDLAALEEGFPLDTSVISGAAMAVAELEDALIFEGSKALGIDGLATAKGTQSAKLASWAELGAAAGDLIKAVTALDAAGFHGPYLLGLAPEFYNLLLRRYPQGSETELDHVAKIVGTKPVKAPAIRKAGVLLASGKQFASIAIGQDLMTGFVGPAGADYEFKITESLAPRIRVPEAVCVLKP